jgi:G:T-mismatch repair DNA endonuclease (very short patch repair protein)
MVSGSRKAEGRRPARFAVRPDFVFPKLKLAVFVDGCFRLRRASLARLPPPRRFAAAHRLQFSTSGILPRIARMGTDGKQPFPIPFRVLGVFRG